MSAVAVPPLTPWTAADDQLLSPALGALGVVAGFTTRPLGSMGGSGTPLDAARDARAALAARLGFADVVRVKQVHGTRIVYAPFVRPAPALPAPAEPLSKAPEADGLWTDRAGVLLGVVAGDCVPILVADDGRRVGAAHAGWEGTTRGVAGRLVETLRDAGADPARLTAALGPSIGPCCYSVGAERAGVIRARLGVDAPLVALRGGEAFDLWAANVAQLRAVGVRRIEVAGTCTKCGGADTWSWRAGDVGLLGLAFIGRRA